MRMMILFGTIALSAALASARLMPTWSPYAVMAFNVNPTPAPTVESRAAAVTSYGSANVVSPNGNAPT
jgi:hypothetical protein